MDYRTIETVRTKNRGTETILKEIIPTLTLTLADLANTKAKGKGNTIVTRIEIIKETR